MKKNERYIWHEISRPCRSIASGHMCSFRSKEMKSKSNFRVSNVKRILLEQNWTSSTISVHKKWKNFTRLRYIKPHQTLKISIQNFQKAKCYIISFISLQLSHYSWKVTIHLWKSGCKENLRDRIVVSVTQCGELDNKRELLEEGFVFHSFRLLD